MGGAQPAAVQSRARRLDHARSPGRTSRRLENTGPGNSWYQTKNIQQEAFVGDDPFGFGGKFGANSWVNNDMCGLVDGYDYSVEIYDNVVGDGAMANLQLPLAIVDASFEGASSLSS